MTDFEQHLQAYPPDPESLTHIRRHNISSLDDLLNVIADHGADLDLRKSACSVLGNLARRDERYSVYQRPVLLALLSALHSPDADLRTLVILALWWQPHTTATVQALVDLVHRDPVEDVRLHAIHGLGKYQADYVVPLLVELAQDKHVGQPERIFAIVALECTGDLRAVPVLHAIMLDDVDDVEVRAVAAELLSHMAEQADMPTLLPDFVKLLQHESVELRFWAAFGLVTMAGLDVPAVLPVLDRAVAYDDAVLPGWWSVSREAAPALEYTWYQRLAVCTDRESCCCRSAGTYLISPLWEYEDYMQRSRVGADIVPFEQQSDLDVDPDWLAGQLAQQWPDAQINVRHPQPEALLLDWRLDMPNGMMLGGLHRDRLAVFLTGDTLDVATFALWYRGIIPPQHTLRLYWWADRGCEIHPGKTPADLVVALRANWPVSG
ncbi:MAG: HEAT repeat domain-containing protein [Chloroflexi bacterium]|nr:HEAT repeat domain-containing protein [Chloroflexota bacterium]